MTNSDHRDKQIAFLEEFFDGVRDNSLFNNRGDTLSQMRTRVCFTLNDLLVWGRPHLLRTRGLLWPYEKCALIVPELEKLYHQNTDKSAQKQALLFLAFLPVPDQWRWLSKAIDTLPDDPEIINFLITERQTIQSKLAKKSQDTFKLRHFIQILKSPCLPHEKGVIRIFSLPYLFLNKQVLQKISEHYVFFVEPAAGIIFRHAWWRVFTELEDPCIFGLGGEEDRRFVAMQSNAYPISLAHGDFLQDTPPPSVSVAKDIDIVFNATFDDMPRKRHMFMLELLNDQRLLTKKALFIGRGSHRNVEVFKTMVDDLGLNDRVTILSNIRRQEIPMHLARCTAGVHLSLHENTCRCVYEYFRADIPCIISSVTAGVDMTIFNHETGLVGNDDQLAEIIATMLDNLGSYSPRKWFLENSGSQHASRKLNLELKKFFIDNGYLWQNNIVPLDSSGATRYVEIDQYRHFLPDFKQLLSWLQPLSTGSLTLTVDEM